MWLDRFQFHYAVPAPGGSGFLPSVFNGAVVQLLRDRVAWYRWRTLRIHFP